MGSAGHWPAASEVSPIEAARSNFPKVVRKLGGMAASDSLTGVAIAALREGRPERLLTQLDAIRRQVEEVEQAFRAAWGRPLSDGRS